MMLRPGRVVQVVRAGWLVLVGLVMLGATAAPARAETVLRIGTVAPEGSRYMKDMRSIGTEIERLHVWLWSDDTAAGAAVKVIGIISDVTSLSGLVERLRAGTIDIWPYPPLAVVGFGLQRFSRFMTDVPFTFLSGALIIRK